MIYNICFWHSNGTHKIIRMKETIIFLQLYIRTVLIIQLYTSKILANIQNRLSKDSLCAFIYIKCAHAIYYKLVCDLVSETFEIWIKINIDCAVLSRN